MQHFTSFLLEKRLVHSFFYSYIYIYWCVTRFRHRPLKRTGSKVVAVSASERFLWIPDSEALPQRGTREPRVPSRRQTTFTARPLRQPRKLMVLRFYIYLATFVISSVSAKKEFITTFEPFTAKGFSNSQYTQKLNANTVQRRKWPKK